MKHIDLKFIKKYFDIIILLALLIIGGFLSLSFGPALSEWDVLNYHIYAPWAFLNDRIGYDILPAGIRSYFNPILDIPFYIMLKYFGNYPSLITFFQGFYYGGVVFLGYKLSTLFKIKNRIRRFAFRLGCVFLIMTAPVILYETGSLFNDLFVALFILGALYIYLKKIFFCADSRKRILNILFASFLLGAVSGLKLTSNIMVLGMFFIGIVFIKSVDKPIKVIFYSILGFLAGFLIINGYWYYKIWEVFKNPFFPYFNNLFHSPYGADSLIINESYTRVLQNSFWAKLLYPLNISVSFGSWLFKYTDLRLLLVAFSSFYLPLFFLYGKIKSLPFHIRLNNKMAGAMLVFVFATYLMWINIFPIIRYIIPIIVVSCILIIYSIYLILNKLKSERLFVGILVLMLCFIYKYSKVNNINFYEIRDSYSYSLIKAGEHVNIADNSVVILGHQFTSCIVPWLNKTARYVMLTVPLKINISSSTYSYANRSIDYYYSKYYEDFLKKLVKNAKDVYVLYSLTSSTQDVQIMYNALNAYIPYMTSKKKVNCQKYMWYQICKIK